MVGVEFGHHVADALQVSGTGGDDQRVHTLVGGHHNGQRSALGALAKESLNGQGHLTGVGLGEGNDFDFQAEFRLLGVEASNEAVDHGDVLDDGSHDESVHPGVGDHGDRVHRFTPGLGGTVCEESLQGCLQANRGGLLEGEHPKIKLGQTIFGIELGYDAIKHVDGFLGSGRQDGVQAGVGDHGHRHAAFGSIE